MMKALLHFNWNCNATLVDLLTPGVKVGEFLGSKYYDGKPAQSILKGNFKDTILVFKTDAGKYVCIPNTSGNRWLWTMVVENEC
jgi:hypothetical protein